MIQPGIRRWLIGLALVTVGLMVIPNVIAQTEPVATGLLVPCDQTNVVDGKITIENKCTINHFLQQFVVVAQWGQSIVVLLGVLMIVWGGVQWITAGGRPTKIDEGKRIVAGTIIGIMISFSAYIIVNFSVAAITGTTSPALNPFSGPVATIFGGTPDERPFSGTGGIENRTSCRATWDRNCSNQIFCADPGTRPGKISQLQERLNGRGCACNAVDGCFGEDTAICVRKFQIANDLPPTGVVDTRTDSLIFGSGVDCSAAFGQVLAVSSELPGFSVARASFEPRGSTGCCVVKKNIGGVPTTIMCADGQTMTARTCAALGPDNIFVQDERCLQNTTTKTECGFCYNGSNNRCFQMTGEYWCTNIVQATPPVEFSLGACNGHPLCDSGGLNQCKNTLYQDDSF